MIPTRLARPPHRCRWPSGSAGWNTRTGFPNLPAIPLDRGRVAPLCCSSRAGIGARMLLARPATPSPQPARLAGWLAFVAVLGFLIVVVGGGTRLPQSGLSITEGNPLSGAIPPLTRADWLAEFDAYKRIPEYQEINRGMSLSEFKRIFFW